MKNSFFTFSLLLAMGTVLFFSCKKNDDTGQLKKDLLENYAFIVHANYDDCYQAALELKNEINAFVATPTQVGFDKVKAAWLAARIPYGQSEAFRFYGGPIDDADGPEGLINAWPLDENFIDYVQGVPNAGLINNPADYPVISAAVLESLNESISETSIFTGFHAIEFLLWGQDFSTTGPGTRPYTDYVINGTAANPERRGQYLKVLAEMLVEHIGSVRDEWAENGSFRQMFVQQAPADESIDKIFSGLGEFTKGELSGERMFVAIDTKDQENEHSCFSDNTILDIKMNFLGAKNVYFGKYVTTDNTSAGSGESLNQLGEMLNSNKAKAVRDAFDDAEAKINAIPAPFDQTIVNNPNSVIPAIEALRTLSDKLVDLQLEF